MADLSLPFFGPLAWIDVILLVWFVLTAFIRAGRVHQQPGDARDEVGLDPGDVIPRSRLPVSLHYVVQRACGRHTRRVHQSPLEEHARVDQYFECHNTTSWNDIVNVGFYKHH